MTKYLLLALLIAWLVYASPWSGRRTSQTPAQRKPAPQPPPQPQVMVACAHCGVHLPVGDAIASPQASSPALHFCSEAHRRAGPRPH
jgi:uncharacterized protein